MIIKYHYTNQVNNMPYKTSLFRLSNTNSKQKTQMETYTSIFFYVKGIHSLYFLFQTQIQNKKVKWKRM